METFQHDLTSGSVGPKLIKFSMPLLLSFFIQALYSVADMLIVSWFVGSSGISGVGIGTQVTMVVTNAILGFSTGATVLIAQYLGAKRHQDVSETVATVFSSFILFGAVITAVMLLSNEGILRFINAPAESFAYAKDYVDICMGGTIFIFLYNGISAVLRGMGDSKRPLIFVAIAAASNVVLDLILVGLLGMEAAGAAIATVAAQGVSVVLSCIYLYRRGFLFDFKLKSFRIHRSKLKNMVRLGLPTSVQQTLVATSFLLLMGLINQYGVHASAAATVVSKLSQFALMPTQAMGSAISSMAGQNIGAGRYDRAMDTMKTGVRLSVLIALTITLAVEFFPEPILRLFTSDAQDLAIGVPYLRVYCIDWFAVAFLININGLIIGSGHTMFPLINSLMANVVIRVPLAYLLAKGFAMGMQGVALANAVSPVLTTIMAVWYVATGRWKEERGRRIVVVE